MTRTRSTARKLKWIDKGTTKKGLGKCAIYRGRASRGPAALHPGTWSRTVLSPTLDEIASAEEMLARDEPEDELAE